jgi:tripartite ATP-independent transporter DctM subunit
LAALFYRSLTWRQFYALILDGVRATSVVGMIIASALVFNYVVASENIPSLVASKLAGIEISPLAFLLLVNLLFLMLGCLFDAATLLLVVVPLFMPSVRALGIDPVHFGVVIVVNIMIGLVTPPYGVLLFVINAVTDIPLRDIIREIWPFIVVLMLALLTMILIPETVLFLPRQFGYK